MDGFAGMVQQQVKKVELFGEKERRVFGKNLNLYSNSNAVTSSRDKKDCGLKTELKIDTRIFYHVRF